MEGIEDFHLWSVKIEGARQLLDRIGKKNMRLESGPPGNPYSNAIYDLIMGSMDAMSRYMAGDIHICYRNHQTDKKGKLIKCEAFYRYR